MQGAIFNHGHMHFLRFPHLTAMDGGNAIGLQEQSLPCGSAENFLERFQYMLLLFSNNNSHHFVRLKSAHQHIIYLFHINGFDIVDKMIKGIKG